MRRRLQVGMENKIDVAVMCDAWAEAAPYRLRIADVIEPRTAEEARRLAATIAAEHGPLCCAAIRVTEGVAPRVVEEVLGTRSDCRDTERHVIEAMIARGQEVTPSGTLRTARGSRKIGRGSRSSLHSGL